MLTLVLLAFTMFSFKKNLLSYLEFIRRSEMREEDLLLADISDNVLPDLEIENKASGL